MIPQEHILALSVALFVIGGIGMLIRRNWLVVLMCLELMRGAAHLAFVAFDYGALDRLEPLTSQHGQVLSLISLAVGAAELIVGVAIIVSLVRNRDSVDIDEASLLRW